MDLVLYLTPLTKIIMKWIKVLTIRPDTVKLLEENVEKKFLNTGLRDDFFFYDAKGTNTKSKKQQIGITSHFKSFFIAKETINKMKRQASYGRKTFCKSNIR